MSIKTNAEQIRDESITGANTATRVGGNLVEIADDLIAKQTAIDDNTVKVGITTGQASAIVDNTTKVSFDSTSSTRLENTSGTNTGDQDLSGKQDLLVSATNIKTINGTTLLGSGDLVISGGGGISGSGTTNKIAKFTATGVIGDSSITDTGTLVSTSTDATINGLFIGNKGNIFNTIFGSAAGGSLTSGSQLVAIGRSAASATTSGFGGTAIGVSAANNNTSGGSWVAIGNSSAFGNLTSSNWTAIGSGAGRYIANKSTSVVSIQSSTFIGQNSGPLGDSQTNQIAIGVTATGLGSNTTVIGNTSTVFGRWFGRLLAGTVVDNGIDELQINGSASVTTLKTSSFTVATLPAPPLQGLGAIAHVTDALNPTYLGTLTGGGTVKCPVFYNGTAWVSS